jgi:ADP-heptose:LPS heptosyltransferase
MTNKLVISKYSNVLANVNGKIIQFKNHEAEVDQITASILLSRPGYSLSKHDSFKTAKRICIARNMGIGDVLFVSTIPAYIKKINPNCHLTFLTFSRHFRLLKDHPHIDQIDDIININNTTYLSKFDYIMNFNNFFESGISYNQGNAVHRVDMLRMYYKASVSDWDTNIYLTISNEEKLFANACIDTLRKRNLKIIGIVTQATEMTRRYPDNPKLISYLADKGYGVVILSPGEMNKYNHQNIINMSGKTNLGQLIGLINSVDLIISPDTGPLHIAGALNKKIVTFFNSFPPFVRTRFYKNCFAFYPEMGCPRKLMPCGYARCTAPCFKTITPQMFVNKIEELFKGEH